MNAIFVNAFYIALIAYALLAANTVLKVMSFDSSFYASPDETGINKRKELYTNIMYSALCGIALICIVVYIQMQPDGPQLSFSFNMPSMIFFYVCWFVITFMITIHPSMISNATPIDTSLNAIINSDDVNKNIIEYKHKCMGAVDEYKALNNCDDIANGMYNTLNKIKSISKTSGRKLDAYSGTLYDAMFKVDKLTYMSSSDVNLRQMASDAYESNTMSSVLHYGMGIFIVFSYMGIFRAIFDIQKIKMDDLNRRISNMPKK